MLLKLHFKCNVKLHHIQKECLCNIIFLEIFHIFIFKISKNIFY